MAWCRRVWKKITSNGSDTYINLTKESKKPMLAEGTLESEKMEYIETVGQVSLKNLPDSRK